MKEMHSVFQAMQDLQQQFFAFAAQISMLDKNVSRAVPSPQVARPMEFRPPMLHSMPIHPQPAMPIMPIPFPTSPIGQGNLQVKFR